MEVFSLVVNLFACVFFFCLFVGALASLVFIELNDESGGDKFWNLAFAITYGMLTVLFGYLLFL